MKIDKDLILAFDIQDTKKIINLIKEKKRKIDFQKKIKILITKDMDFIKL